MLHISEDKKANTTLLVLKRRIECSAGKIILVLQGAFKIAFGQLYAILSTCVIVGLKKTERFKRFTKSQARMTHVQRSHICRKPGETKTKLRKLFMQSYFSGF